MTSPHLRLPVVRVGVPTRDDLVAVHASLDADLGSGGARARRADARTATVGVMVGGLIVLAMVLGSAALTLAVSLVAIAVSVVSPLVGTVVLAFLAPVPRPLVIPTPGLYVALSVSILLGLVLRLPVDRPRLTMPSKPVLLLGAFFALAAASYIGGLAEGYTGPRGEQIEGLFAQLTSNVLVFGAACLAFRGRSPFPALAALLIATVLVSTAAVAQAIGAETLFGQWIEPSPYGPRVTGPVGDPNYFGSYLATAATLAIGLAATARSARLRVALLAIAGMTCVTIVLTQSRGALLAVACGVIVVLFLRDRKLGVAALVMTVFLAALAYPAFSDWRFGRDTEAASMGLSASEDSSGRLGAWLASESLFMSSPLTGIGFGRFVEESSTGIEAHNWYANVLAELGVFGLALWMLFVLSVALALRRRPPSARMVGYSVLAAFLVANVFLELPTDKESTAPAFIMLAAACVGDWAAGSRERRQPSEVTQQRSTQPRSTQQRLPGQPSLPRSS